LSLIVNQEILKGNLLFSCLDEIKNVKKKFYLNKKFTDVRRVLEV